MKERSRGFISGVLASVITLSLIGTASATIGPRNITADYSDIKITLNGTEITPTDANGTMVEPFAVNGTTYLPVRAVANALGIDVQWDGATNTVDLSGTSGVSWEVMDELTLYYDLYRMADYFAILQSGIEDLKDTVEMKGAGYATAADVAAISDSVTEYFENCNASAGEMIDFCITNESLNIMGTLIDAQSALVQARNSVINVRDGQIPDEYYTSMEEANALILQAKSDVESMYHYIYQSIQ